MNNRRSVIAPTRAVALLLGSVPLIHGCQHGANPFRDELAGRAPVTTPSVEAARAVPVDRPVSHRPHAPAIVSAGNGAVKHGPLYFEDPFEETGGDDRTFAWTGEDYWHSLYGPARFLVSAVLFPVSAALTSPWQVMESDGQPGRRVFGMEHDAEPWAGEIR